nr:MAG TPA: hypothetical protein [Caudoviricetes sp.]DAW73440.1 MAG TPA: hypothetical protein [Caudoviricetes sp.]DAX60178.1 MAG TPA: hypothetical protein [Caudoviricetes sp.]
MKKFLIELILCWIVDGARSPQGVREVGQAGCLLK